MMQTVSISGPEEMAQYHIEHHMLEIVLSAGLAYKVTELCYSNIFSVLSALIIVQTFFKGKKLCLFH